MSYSLEDVHPPVERSELPDRLAYRWTDEGGTEVRFEAGTADELAERGLDALVDARRATAQTRHDGGRGKDYTRFRRLYLHVEDPAESGRWLRVGHARGFTRYVGEGPVEGRDDTMLREAADDLHDHALAWAAHALNLGRLAGDLGNQVRG